MKINEYVPAPLIQNAFSDPHRDDRREAARQDRLVRLLRHERDLLAERAQRKRDRWTAPLILNAFAPSS